MLNFSEDIIFLNFGKNFEGLLRMQLGIEIQEIEIGW